MKWWLYWGWMHNVRNIYETWGKTVLSLPLQTRQTRTWTTSVDFVLHLQDLCMAIAFRNEHVNTPGSYMDMLSETMLLGAYHLIDKISILLNVMNSGLYYMGSESVSGRLPSFGYCCGLSLVTQQHWQRMVVLSRYLPKNWRLNGKGYLFYWIPCELKGIANSPKIDFDIAISVKGLQLAMHW